MTPLRSAKASLVFTALVAAIAVTAMGFGLWSQTLVVNGDVQTGQVLAEFSNDPGFEPFTDDGGMVDDINNFPTFDDGEKDPNGIVDDVAYGIPNLRVPA